MAVRLFKLSNVPDDEAEDVRLLLSEHEILFYETHTGGFGVGTPAIWLHDDEQFDRATTLIDSYQKQRYEEKHAEYERQREEGRHTTFLDIFMQHPILVVVFLFVSLFILYASLSPFLNFGK